MRKKLTITADNEVYEGLHSRIGRGKMSKFFENLVRHHIIKPDLEEAYAEMGKDKHR